MIEGVKPAPDRSVSDRYYAEEIKRQVSCRDFLAMNGIQTNRHGFAICPLHTEKTASLKVYDGDRGWYCHGCHTGGSVIELAMNLCSCDLHEAVKQLNDDFNLGLKVDDPPSNRSTFLMAAKLAKNRTARQHEQDELDAIERAYWKAFDEWRKWDETVINLDHLVRNDEPFPRWFCVALEKRAEAYEQVKIAEERRLTYGRK